MVKRELSREEMLRVISRRSVGDEIDSFMLGLSVPLEREIMRYIWNNGNTVNKDLLVMRFVHVVGSCTKKNLERRLESLLKFGFIKRFDYRGTIFYEVNKDDEESPKEEKKIGEE